jgi:hypothetical protein
MVVDVAAPPVLPVLARMDLANVVNGVVWDANRAIVSADWPNFLRASLHILDLTNLARPDVVGICVGTSQPVSDMACEDDVVLSAQETYGLQIYDVHAAAEPRIAGRFQASGIDARSVVVHEGIAYVGTWAGGLHVVDVSNPDQPLQIGYTNVVVAPRELALGPGWLAAQDGTHVAVLGLADPTAPARLASLAESAEALTADGDFLYVLNTGTRLRTYDLSSPAAPVLVGDLQLSGNCVSISVEAGRAYVAAGADGLLVIDVADPAHPILLSAAFTPSTATRVVADDGYVYVSCLESGLLVYDARDPANPRPLAPVPGLVWDFALGPQFAYTLDNSYPHTFSVIYRQCVTTAVESGSGPSVEARTLTASPNPFNPQTTIRYSLASAGPVSLTIYDLRGRPVRSLLKSAHRAAGAQAVTWNGRDDAGVAAPSGVYLVRVEAGAEAMVQRVALVREMLPAAHLNNAFTAPQVCVSTGVVQETLIWATPGTDQPWSSTSSTPAKSSGTGSVVPAYRMDA